MKVLKDSYMTFTYSSKRKKSISIILAIMLFLYCINFHSLVIGLIFSYLVMFKCFLARGVKLRINLLPIFLIAFTVTYSLFSYYYGLFSLFSVINFMLVPIAFYFTGTYAIKQEIPVKSLFYYVYLVIFSFFIFGIFCIGKTASYGGTSSLLINARVVSTPWSDIQLNATNIGAYFSMGLSLMGFTLTFKGKDYMIGIKLLSIIILTLSIISELLMGNRTGVVILAASFVIVYLVYNFYGYKQNKTKIITTFMIITTFLLLVYAIQSNIFGIGEKLFGSTLLVRLSEGNLFEDIRFKAWEAAFVGLFEYPLGGKQAYLPLNYAHNLWLDVGYTAGIIPFIFLLIFSFLAFKDIVKLVKSKETPVELKTLLTGVYVSLFINFFVEPILEGYFIHFTMFCFIVGMTNKYVSLTNKVVVHESMERKDALNANTLVRQRSTS